MRRKWSLSLCLWSSVLTQLLFSKLITLVLVPPLCFYFLVRFHFLQRSMDGKGKNEMGKPVKRDAGVSDNQYTMPEEDDHNTSRKKKGGSSSGGGRNCQVEKCTADLSDSKQYHRRHKVCEAHAKAQVVLMCGIRQRFCQQCSRFHELSEFDETKKSCRRRLAGHNERRRKNAAESNNGEGSSRKGMGTKLNDMVCGQVDDKGRIKIAIQENDTYKHFQIR